MPPSSSSNSLRLTLLAALLAVVGAAALLYVYLDGARPPLVRDDAGLLQPEERRKLAAFHRFLLQDHGIDYRVVTRRDAGDLGRLAVEAFEDMQVGSESAAARGLLLLIDPAADRVRLEVGRSLEGSFPDAFVAYVEQRQMVPFFRSGRVADGILATTELIVARVLEEKASGGYADHLAAEGTAGGGAETAARIGAGEGPAAAAAAGRPAAAVPLDSPRAAVDAYLAAMAARNADPDLAVYAGETRRMLRGWTVTPAQMDGVARAYRRCAVESVQTAGDYAVVRYGLAERACAPFFLQREDGAWRLDLTMMQKALRFGRNNAWRLDPGATHPYGFAFTDWRFDAKGFPLGEK